MRHSAVRIPRAGVSISRKSDLQVAMPVDHIRYDLLTQQALRAVVRRVLADVAKNGAAGRAPFLRHVRHAARRA